MRGRSVHVHGGEGGDVAGLHRRAGTDNDGSGHDVDINAIQKAAASKL